MVRGYLLLSVACLLAVVCAQKSSLDAVDIDSVFKNERLLKNYVDCLLDKKPCSKEGSELKCECFFQGVSQKIRKPHLLLAFHRKFVSF